MVSRTLVLLLAAASISPLQGCGHESPVSPSTAPTLLSASPQAAAIGDSVTLTGTNFEKTGNHVRIGEGYLHNLSSADGTTLSFPLPAYMDVCSPWAQVCIQIVIAPKPGDYRLSVINLLGTSNELPFTIIER